MSNEDGIFASTNLFIAPSIKCRNIDTYTKHLYKPQRTYTLSVKGLIQGIIFQVKYFFNIICMIAEAIFKHVE
jgi:hypothetical protein